jgi:putative ABC transport system substrate-binding protein
MRRRQFIALFGGAAAAWPLAARAQQAERIRRIGMVIGSAENDAEGQKRVGAFVQALRKLGWIEGQNLQIDYRWSPDIARMRANVAELLASAPDVLFAHTTAAVRALRDGTTTIPIVFAIITDPVGSGLITNLAHPGGNVTGFTNFEFATSGKWLELLKEAAPGIAQIEVIFSPRTATYAGGYVRQLEAIAASSGVQLSASGMADAPEIERVISHIGRDGGLIILPDLFTTVHRDLIVAQAAQHRVPAIYPYRYFVANGGLISYGVDIPEQFRQAAVYVNRILKGESPSDLPVQAPTKLELVINLTAAKSLGLTIPPTLLATADEVIE